MKRSFGRIALFGLAAMSFGAIGTGLAQDAGPSVSICTNGCAGQQGSIAVMGMPAMAGAQVGVVTTGGIGVGFEESPEVVKNQPYQANAVTEVKQTLADGSHISQTTSATVARDTDGRTVRIQKLGAIGPWKSASDSSQDSAPTLTTIFDPVAKTHIDYTSDRKVAHVLPLPPLPPGGTPAESREISMFNAGIGSGGPGSMAVSIKGHGDPPQLAGGPDAKTESLGTKSIDGIPVTGTRTTDAIPAGTIGNDKDLVISRETWYSPDLKLVIQSTQTDPRFGESTYSLSNIQRSEPDPSLFQVPAGYTIEKAHVMVQSH